MSKTAQSHRVTTANHATSEAARAEQPVSVTVSSTEAQNEFGRVLDLAARDQVVVITRHNAPRAVLISADRFRALAGAEAVMLDTLTNEFDALLARMQTPEVRAGTERGFRTTPEQMGRAAVAAARRDRGR
jgi:prevent-host-death family protein